MSIFSEFDYEEQKEKDIEALKKSPLERAKSEMLRSFLSELEALKDQAEEQSVTSPESSQRVFEMICQVKTIKNHLEKKRKEILQPTLNFTNDINDFARKNKDICQSIMNGLICKRDSYEAKIALEAKKAREEALKREEEARKQELLKAQQEDIFSKAIKDPQKIPNELTAPPIVPPVHSKTKVVCAEGSATKKKVWRWTIENLELVPREYLTMNPALINQAVREGAREIAGVKIYQETETSYRAKPRRY